MENDARRAYRFGKKLQNRFDGADFEDLLRDYDFWEIFSDSYGDDYMPTHLEGEMMRIGYSGYDYPQPATGWRYGKIPETGVSYNARDDRAEAGLSIAWLDGAEDETQDLISLMFIAAGKKLYHVRGLLHPCKRGADGEPLFLLPDYIN